MIMKLFTKIVIISLLFPILINAQNQCQAITKKGTQCKRKAMTGSIYCAQHSKMNATKTVGNQNQVLPPASTRKQKEINKNSKQVENRQCQAITKEGKQCKRKALPGSNYCWQHQK